MTERQTDTKVIIRVAIKLHELANQHILYQDNALKLVTDSDDVGASRVLDK